MQKVTFRRQKILLALLQMLGGNVPSVDMQKYLFLFCELCQKNKSYEFIPYKFGCFSFQSYADKRKLIELGVIKDQDSWELSFEENVDWLDGLLTAEKYKIKAFVDQFSHLKGKDLVRKVYTDYPYYATKSEIAEQILSEEEFKKVASEKVNYEDQKFFTIGYEGTSFENYLNRLLLNGVKALCDVRKNPLSRKYGFSKKTLSETVRKLGIEYYHLPDLGIVSENRKNLHTQVDYDRLFDDYENTVLQKNKQALDDLEKIFAKYGRVAITCFEADHCQCHRARVAKALSLRPAWSYDIIHI